MTPRWKGNPGMQQISVTNRQLVPDKNGDIEIDTINEIFKTDLSAGDDYSRLNGLLHEKLHDIPKEGDKLEIDSLRIIVEKVSKNKPEKIRIEKIKG